MALRDIEIVSDNVGSIEHWIKAIFVEKGIDTVSVWYTFPIKSKNGMYKRPTLILSNYSDSDYKKVKRNAFLTSVGPKVLSEIIAKWLSETEIPTDESHPDGSTDIGYRIFTDVNLGDDSGWDKDYTAIFAIQPEIIWYPK